MADLLVIGVDRPLGRSVMVAARRAGYDVVGCTAAEVDPRAPATCERLVADVAPRAVIDCDDRGAGGAMPSPQARRVAARAAAGIGALSVLAASAEVFDGARTEPYVESDVPTPDTQEGEAWVAAERAVTAANPRHAIVRSAWLLGGAAPDVVDDVIERCSEPGAAPFDAVAAGTLTTADDLAAALVSLTPARAYGVFHLAGGGAVTRLALARMVARTLGLPGRPVPAGSAGTGLPHAGRRHVLATRRRELRTLPDWRLSVSAYLEDGTAARSPDDARSTPGPRDPEHD